ncbi:MAG TPA: nuclear transport factor 2 family protein [Hymenobacter sp.]|nr:nuclear transport factor 2 family protein [Hymenobacter sp.]
MRPSFLGFASLTALLLAAVPLRAQQPVPPSNEYLLRASLNVYFASWTAGYTSKMAAILLPGSRFTQVTPSQTRHLNQREYLRELQPLVSRLTVDQIVDIFHTDNIASAVTQVDSGPKRYTSLLHLRKREGRWFIAEVVTEQELQPEQPRNLKADNYGY